MRLHKDTNKPDRQLYHDDIEGSKPRNKFLFRTKRCVNPLEPEYTLPSFVISPPVAPKFTRDSYDVSDIEGTKSRPLYPLEQRHSHLVDDIEVTWFCVLVFAVECFRSDARYQLPSFSLLPKRRASIVIKCKHTITKKSNVPTRALFRVSTFSQGFVRNKRALRQVRDTVYVEITHLRGYDFLPFTVGDV